LQVVAGIILGINASKTIACEYGEPCVTKSVDMSNAAVAWIWILGGLGTTLMAVALIAFAVMLGIRASRDA